MDNQWLISKEFSFDYGHRVWSQVLNEEFSEDNRPKCRHLHGHTGKVKIHLSSNKLTSGVVTDFKHLNWVKTFIDATIDHKFIVDLNDPWLVNIINAKPKFVKGKFESVAPLRPLNTSDATSLAINRVVVPHTEHFAGFVIDTSNLTGVEKEYFESFFIVSFVPTSENLSKWLFDCVDAKMQKIGVNAARVDWWETPKSLTTYTRNMS